jgi:hypothetical protein
MLAEQASDGGFAALAGAAARRVVPTIDALRALISLARSL